jgi:hypothetical protein
MFTDWTDADSNEVYSSDKASEHDPTADEGQELDEDNCDGAYE